MAFTLSMIIRHCSVSITLSCHHTGYCMSCLRRIKVVVCTLSMIIRHCSVSITLSCHHKGYCMPCLSHYATRDIR